MTLVPTRWLAVALAGLMPLTAVATPVWQQDEDVVSSLGSYSSYSSDPNTLTATTIYTNQTVTNNASTTDTVGMYIGWVWSLLPDSTGNWVDTALPWDNTTHTFTNGSVSLSISYPGGNAGSLTLGDVQDDTWIGVPYAPTGYSNSIATAADWSVPFIDFGVLAPGASTTYDMTITMHFPDSASFEAWNQSGSFEVVGEGVRAVPEPSVLWLSGLALLAAAAVLRRNRRA